MRKTDFEAKSKYYEKVISHLLGNVYCKDEKLRYVWCNNNFAQVLKLSHPSKIVGKTDYDFLSKELADTMLQNDLKVIAERQAVSYEETGLDERGRVSDTLIFNFSFFTVHFFRVTTLRWQSES